MFKEWLPDQPSLDNPGLLEAENCLPRDGHYKPFKALGSANLNALASEPLGGLVTDLYTYVGLNTSLQRSTTVLGTWTDYSQGTSYATANAWSFARFDDLVMAANGVIVPQAQTLGSVSDFANLATTGTAPVSAIVGRIGQFAFVGDTSSADYHVQWSAIDDARNWPTPDTVTANSVQAGQQYLNPEWGRVTGIIGGDQFGIIFQVGGLTRVTYVGGSVAFQFDEIEGAKGTRFPWSIVNLGNSWYYISDAGFCVTNGVTSVQFAAGKFDAYFWENSYIGEPRRIRGAVDPNKKIIFWQFPSTNATAYADRIIAYNYETGNATLCEQNLNCLLSDPEAVPDSNLTMIAFNTSHEGCKFNGSNQITTITTGEVSFNLGGRAFVQGVKPLVNLAAGATPTITVAIGARSDQDDDSISYTSEVTANSRTGFCAFRSDAQYHRARLTISGVTYNSASGLEVQAVPSGAA